MTTTNEIQLPLKKYKKGKVRDVFEVDDHHLLIVSSDRISAFDYVLPSVIPDKGKILNQIAAYWFRFSKDFVPNHIVCDVPEELDQFASFKDVIEKRSILTKKMDVFPIEAIVRGYVVGSGWKSYQKSGDICGIKLAEGLQFADQIPEPIFTPSTKADEGHDENIPFEKMKNMIGREDAETIKDISLRLFSKISEAAKSKGIIIADTKFEFGRDDSGQIVLIDEIFTPDSSRFWKVDEYNDSVSQEPRKDPPSFDKQYVRDYLLASDWDRNSVPPELPDDVIQNTRKKYLEIYQILTGQNL